MRFSKISTLRLQTRKLAGEMRWVGRSTTSVGLSPDDRDRIQSAINNGSYQIAEDFIERIERNEELPTPETATNRPFDRFFPHIVANYSMISE